MRGVFVFMHCRTEAVAILKAPTLVEAFVFIQILLK